MDYEFAMIQTYNLVKTNTIPIEELNRLRTTVVQSPDSIASLTNARDLVDLTRRSEVAIASMTGDLRTVRSVILDTSTSFWEWYDKEIPALVAMHVASMQQDTRARFGGAESWSVLLTQKVADFILQGKTVGTVELPESFGVPRRHVTLRNPRGRLCPPTDPSYLQLMVDNVQTSVLQALDIGTRQDERVRAWVFSMLKERCGMHFLKLECAWDLFVNFRRNAYTSAKTTKAQREDVYSCGEAVTKHLHDSNVGELLDILKTILEGNIDRSGGMLDRHPLLTNLYEREWDELWTLVLTSMCLESGADVQGNDKLQGLVRVLRKDPNAFLPFRERAPDLKRARGEGGFYRTDVIRTTSGIFSALIWRVISFNTRFSREQPMLYADDQAYLEQVASCPSDKNYSCLPNAYGRPIKGNGPDVAKVFWKSLTNAEDKWEDFIAESPSFKECIHYFRKRDKQKKNRFPGLGNLLSFLLVSDLAGAGICSPPTELEVAACMQDNNGGSFKELQKLNLLPATNHAGTSINVEDVDNAFCRVQTFLSNKLTATEKGFIGFSPICVEHILCKAHKLGIHLRNAKLQPVQRKEDIYITV